MICDIRLMKSGKFICASCKSEISEEQWNSGNIPECSGPSMLTQVVNAATATVRHVANSIHEVPSEIAEKRLSICESNKCGYYLPNDDNPRCGHCGCFLKIKTKWAKESCPIGEWGDFSKKQGCLSC